jgi:hypothetical protein
MAAAVQKPVARGLVARPATLDDAAVVAPELRALDRLEIKLATGLPIEDALAASLAASDRAWCVEHDGRPSALFGVGPWPGRPGCGAVWCVRSAALGERPLRLHRFALAFLPRLRAGYGLVGNWILEAELSGRRWLRSLGFREAAIAPMGPFGARFVRFELCAL